MKRLIVGCAIVLASAGVARAQAPSSLSIAEKQRAPGQSTATEIGIKGLRDGVAMDRAPARVLGGLRATFHPKAGGQLGLRNQAEAQQTEVGAPIRMMFVDASSLRVYDGGSAEALLREVPLVTRLVRVQGQARSLMVQSNAGGTWQTVQMGDVRRAAAIEQVSGILVGALGIAEAELFLVKIPALGLDFLAYRKGAIQLAPLFDTPRLGLKAGETADAAAVLASLVPAAQAVRLTGRSR